MERSDLAAIELFGKKFERYAFFRIIFFGIGLVTLFILVFASPELESLNVDDMTDAEILSSGSLFFWGVILLILIFGLSIIGFIVLWMFSKYLVQLKIVSKTTSSLFLRNIFVCEVSRVVIWIFQLFFIGSASQIPLYALNCISAGISVYEIIQFKKWVGYMADYNFKPSEITPLQTFLKIWNICIISFIVLSFIQFFYDNLFMVMLECCLLLVISVVLWYYGKKIIWLFV